MEIWIQIPNYEEYKISNTGMVKSFKFGKEKILKPQTDSKCYYHVVFSKLCKTKKIRVHQLVAMCFLDHNPCGYKLVVNHKNFIKKDNRVENLEIVTQRENANHKHIKSSSKYTGVDWHKNRNKWRASIGIGKKSIYLGQFDEEFEAHLAYEKALKNIKNNLPCTQED